MHIHNDLNSYFLQAIIANLAFYGRQNKQEVAISLCNDYMYSAINHSLNKIYT